MARIYKNSLCTITSPSPDPTKPLFIERDSHLVTPAVLQLFIRNRSHSGEPSERLGLDQGWEKVVEEITSRDITYWTDRLPALSGLAAKRQQATGDKYLAGLWKSNLKIELLWRVKTKKTPSDFPSQTMCRPGHGQW